MKEVSVADGANKDEYGIIHFFAELIYLAKNIRVVTTGKALVACNCYYGGAGFCFPSGGLRNLLLFMLASERISNMAF